MTRTEESTRTDARALLDRAIALLDRAGVDSARLDAELLLARAAGVARTRVISGDLAVDDAVRREYAALLDRRAAHEPLAYILGRKEFYSLEFEVTPAVLIPRPETETVVAAALALLAGRSTARVLDLGTGSGAIALTLAANAPLASMVASDVSTQALAVARRNAVRLGLAPRVEFRRADCVTVLDGGAALGRFDLIVSNPPYIVDAEIAALQPEIARWEPRAALDGGPDGLVFHRRIAALLDDALAPDGRVIVEIGDGQAAAVSEIFAAAGFPVTTQCRDWAGGVRVLIAGP